MPNKKLQDTYCFLGMPINTLTAQQTLSHIYVSASERDVCFLSTPNVNFFSSSLQDSAFLESLIVSDLNVVDGAPLVWLGRRLGIPIPERVAGASLLEALVMGARLSGRKTPFKLFFFGGDGDVGSKACNMLNARATNCDGVADVICAGYLNPGVGTVEELSAQKIIERINHSEADFLVVSLGAVKGQAWILRNLQHLNIPVVSHLGAAINFISGDVPRAPRWVQRLGCEWLWRIKEQPKLFARYWHDGILLLRVIVTRLVPYWLWLRRHRLLANEPLSFEQKRSPNTQSICLYGALSVSSVSQLSSVLSQLKAFDGLIELDMSRVCYADPGGLGWLLDLEKLALAAGAEVVICHCNKELAQVLKWNHLDRLFATPDR